MMTYQRASVVLLLACLLCSLGWIGVFAQKPTIGDVDASVKKAAAAQASAAVNATADRAVVASAAAEAAKRAKDAQAELLSKTQALLNNSITDRVSKALAQAQLEERLAAQDATLKSIEAAKVQSAHDQKVLQDRITGWVADAFKLCLVAFVCWVCSVLLGAWKSYRRNKVMLATVQANAQTLLESLQKDAKIQFDYNHKWSHLFRDVAQMLLAHFETTDPDAPIVEALKRRLPPVDIG